ncbi:MAG: leucyl/phenylalanyl-tRNA--protein transferase [Qingshengfaniella sp.]
MADDALTPEILLRAYAMGVFPMAEGRDDPDLFWVDPRRRGIFPLDGFHISRSLRRSIRRMDYEVAVDVDFSATVRACANRDETWISDRIFALYMDLHAAGFAHSLEVRDNSGLIGGVYGVCLGAAFFGESMFSTRTDASKIALAYLADRLCQAGFRLFDTQFLTAHLASLGAIEVDRDQYHALLHQALGQPADFTAPSLPRDGQALLQRMTQTS